MCGIFGVFNAKKAAELVVIGLHANQHRAIDYAGIVSCDGTNMYRERGAGLARQVFTKDMLDRLHGKDAVGHIRYPTVSDDADRDNIQPIMGRYGNTDIALTHNGNLTNVDELRILVDPARLTTSMDSELILRLLEKKQTGDLLRDLREVVSHLRGSFSLCLLLPGCLIAIRDGSGNRPLSLGTANGSYFVSSETCAFANVGATLVRDVVPGTMEIVSAGGIETIAFASQPHRQCRFEGIYYSHPSSTVFGESVTAFRLKLGQALEECAPVSGADIVTPIPDSSLFIAMGYAKSGRSGMYLPVIIRNHYVGRTFIAATQAKRDLEISQKFAFSADEIRGRKIVIVDDSIVRGSTLPKVVPIMRHLGAREVHVRIGSPPIRYSCRYGINTPTREELTAASHTVEEIRTLSGADSLEFLPLEVLRRLSPNPDSFCYSCMNGVNW